MRIKTESIYRLEATAAKSVRGGTEVPRERSTRVERALHARFQQRLRLRVGSRLSRFDFIIASYGRRILGSSIG
ncbi:MAG TPA: hypothetical protein VMW38_23570, partial [Terriglobia bacterium]|nr:hypothetical protein [Terriglobia bacterium]